MSWSLTTRPSFFPGFPTWSDLERDMDRDLSRIHRLFSDVAQQVRPDAHGVHHRQPSYAYNEDNTQAHIEIELPGVARENVNISLHGDKLEISANRYPSTLSTSPLTNVPVDKESQKTKQNGDNTVAHDDTVQQHAAISTQQQPTQQQPTPSVVYKLSVPIGNKFDLDKIAATMLGDGILSLIVPKKVVHSATSRVIDIASA